MLDFKNIFIEDLSRDTVGNVFFSSIALRNILNKNSQLIWVSNDFHLNRIEIIVKACAPYITSQNLYAGAPDHVSSDVMGRILKDECNSLARFQHDLLNSSSIEELIFLKYDLYSIRRLQDGFRKN